MCCLDLLCLGVCARMFGVIRACALCPCYANKSASCMSHVCASICVRHVSLCVCMRMSESMLFLLMD